MSPGTTSIVNIDANFKRQVLGFFMTTDPNIRLNHVLSRRTEKTGLWLDKLLELQNWHSTPGSSIWLTGIPGSGKTTLSSLIVQEALCRGSRKVGVAYFYGCFTETQSAVTVISTLVSQLARQNDEAYEALCVYYKSLHRRHGLPNAIGRVPTTDRLVGLFQEISECFEQVYIIIDGLDECDRDVVGILPDISGPGTNVSMAVLSRDQCDIRCSFSENIPGFSIINIEAQDKDVMTFVEHVVTNHHRLQRLPVSLKQAVRASLTTHWNGMYVPGSGLTNRQLCRVNSERLTILLLGSCG